jgi:anthranilate synthase/aminodeoxychorismate synthase-like glutamine amidotransferase
MILVIDNYDSFVYNLARYVERCGAAVSVCRNDAVSLEDIRAMKPEGIIISPGPCTPKEAGISVDVVKVLGSEIPILGVCLGHQAIGEAYGGRTVQAAQPVHGKADSFTHDGEGIFKGLPDPLTGGRYHSLIVELPENSPLEVTAYNEAGEIMGLRHKIHPVYGVQFHPESVLTPQGLQIMQNFVEIVQRCQVKEKHVALA